MESPSEMVVLTVVIHGLIFLAIFAAVYFSIRKGVFSGRRPLARAKSLIEQHLVLEAISACAGELDIQAIINSIGKHAAEMTGFGEWIIWLCDDDGRSRVAELETEGGKLDLDGIRRSDDPRLYSWVCQNAAPVSLDEFVVGLAETEAMREVLLKLSNGLLIPFLDGEKIIGFIILGGAQLSLERRSDQFLSLFGAFAAIIIKKSKLDQQERLLRQKQQRMDNLASLGKLAAGLAHEIRNPLTFIKASAQHLQRGYEFDPKDEELTVGMVDEIDRINQHVEELLVLGRIDPRQFSSVDLSAAVRKAAALAESKAEEHGISIAPDPAEENSYVNGSEDMLRQLILNLIMNGIEATGECGKIAIRSRLRDGWAVIEVEDTGHGIDPKITNKIFDPFFTTKERGTGLGLAIGFSVAQAHGGALELVRSDARGSCFRVKLPPAE